MNDLIVEKRFEYKGYPCVVIFHPMCHRCGYVGIPKGHAVEVNAIDCHGGITYNEAKLYGQKDNDKWWIGFDCAHYRDGHDYESAREYSKGNLEEIERINQLEEINSRIDFGCLPRSKEYVENECRHIVDQIIEFENNSQISN